MITFLIIYSIFTTLWIGISISYNILQNKKEYKSLLNNIQINDKYIDKTWKENIVQIVNINKESSRVKYVFLQIENNKIISDLTWSMNIDSFLDLYIKLE